MLALLLIAGVVEYLLGMDVNLYSSCFPDGPMHLFSSDPCGTQSMLEAHVVVGILLGLLAVGMLLWALRRRIPGLLVPVFGGLLGVVIAAAGGYEFLAMNQSAADSFLMSVGFLMAFGAYFSASLVLRDYARSGGAAVRWTPPVSPNPP